MSDDRRAIGVTTSGVRRAAGVPAQAACQACDGTGRLGRAACPDCDGTGQVTRRRRR